MHALTVINNGTLVNVSGMINIDDYQSILLNTCDFVCEDDYTPLASWIENPHQTIMCNECYDIEYQFNSGCVDKDFHKHYECRVEFMHKNYNYINVSTIHANIKITYNDKFGLSVPLTTLTIILVIYSIGISLTASCINDKLESYISLTFVMFIACCWWRLVLNIYNVINNPLGKVIFVLFIPIIIRQLTLSVQIVKHIFTN